MDAGNRGRGSRWRAGAVGEMRLSAHFDLSEFTASETAARRGIDNDPPLELIGNLKSTAELMERIRALLGKPIIVTSGYRCLELNTAIGSKPSSAHVLGLACDFISPSYGTPYDICVALEPHVTDFGIDQLIYEFGSWVHVGLRDGARGQVFTINRTGTHQGIVA